jgi:hypothetical protein
MKVVMKEKDRIYDRIIRMIDVVKRTSDRSVDHVLLTLWAFLMCAKGQGTIRTK